MVFSIAMLVYQRVTILKNMSSSMGRMTSHIWNGKYKMFQTTDQQPTFMVLPQRKKHTALHDFSSRTRAGRPMSWESWFLIPSFSCADHPWTVGKTMGKPHLLTMGAMHWSQHSALGWTIMYISAAHVVPKNHKLSRIIAGMNCIDHLHLEVEY